MRFDKQGGGEVRAERLLRPGAIALRAILGAGLRP